jgi:argininosuccinate synthase
MRIVLAYSGGLEMSAAIPWLAATYRAEVVTATVDLGVGADLEAIHDRALALGAARAHVLDVRETFARQVYARALAAGATFDDGVPLLAELSLAQIGRSLVEVAHYEHADAVAHGAAEGELQRLEQAIRSCDSTMRVLAPARDRHVSPAEAADDLLAHGVVMPRPHVPRDTRHGASALEPASVDITFEKGLPTAVNGISMPPVELVDTLGMLAAGHDVGPHATPFAAAAFVLDAAHRELRRLPGNPEWDAFCEQASRRYVEIVRNGEWWGLLREALDAFFDRVQASLTGTVRLQLFKGECRRVEASTPRAALGPSSTAALTSA